MTSMSTLKATAAAARTFTPEHVADATVESMNRIDWLNRNHPTWNPKPAPRSAAVAATSCSRGFGDEVWALIYGVDVMGQEKRAVLKGVGAIHCAALNALAGRDAPRDL